MSSALDAAVTITLFVGIAPVLVYLAAVGLLGILMASRTEDQPPWRLSHKLFQLLTLVVQPLLMLGIYVAAIVLACLAAGLTFYYPLAALAISFAAWWFTIERIPAWFNHRLAVHKAGYVKVELESLSADEAIAAVRKYLRDQEIDYSTADLVTERFPLGWCVYTPVDASAMFIVGDSGRIERTSPSTPRHHAQVRFAAQESAIVRARAEWVRRPRT